MLLRRRRWQEGDGRRWHPEQPRVVVQAGVDVRQGGGDADVQLVLVAVERGQDGLVVFALVRVDHHGGVWYDLSTCFSWHFYAEHRQ